MISTDEKYEEMGYTKMGGGAVQDQSGNVYFPKKAKTPLKAVALFCKECFGMDRREKKVIQVSEAIMGCSDPMCPLFEFRNGKNPFAKRDLTEDQKDALRKRLSSINNTIRDGA